MGAYCRALRHRGIKKKRVRIMSKLRAEDLVRSIQELFKKELNGKIIAINAEYEIKQPDSFLLAEIDDKGWFNSLDADTANYNEFVYYGITTNSQIPIQGAGANDFGIFMTVVVNDEQLDPETFYRSMRYIEALRDVVEDNADMLPTEASNMELENWNPENFRDLDNSTFHKIGGIILTTAIA